LILKLVKKKRAETFQLSVGGAELNEFQIVVNETENKKKTEREREF